MTRGAMSDIMCEAPLKPPPNTRKGVKGPTSPYQRTSPCRAPTELKGGGVSPVDPDAAGTWNAGGGGRPND